MARAVAAAPTPVVVQPTSVRRPVLHVRAYPQLVIGSAVLVLLLVGAVLGPFVVRYGPTDTDFSAALQGPSWAHVLGTDQLGRDSLSRALAGARLSMLVAGATVALGLLGGVPLGMISAIHRSWLSSVIMRVMDGILAFPGLILAMAIAFVLGPSVVTVVVALAVVRLPSVARVIRSQAGGLGQLLTDSILGRDLPTVQAIVLFLTFAVVVTSFLVDLVQGVLDPRLRVASG